MKMIIGSVKQKKRFGISRIICEVSLVVKKRLKVSEKSK